MTTRDQRSSLDLGTAAALSLAGHATAAFALLALVHLARLLHWDDPPPPEQTATLVPARALVEIELPQISSDSPLLAVEPVPASAPRPFMGGPLTPRPDIGHAGKGGDELVPEAATNLAQRDDGITRDPSVLSNLSVSQLSRIDAGKGRASYEDRRSSREPMELTFVAMGDTGKAEERRPDARFDAGAGLSAASARSALGGDVGALPFDAGEGETSRKSGTTREGSATPSPGVGVLGGAQGAVESFAAHQAHARPLVDQGSPSVNANDEGRPSDTMDSEQAVAARMQSILQASTSGGRKGAGRGGESGGGAPGAGGERGPGSVASPLGAGGVGQGDVERMGYMRGVQSKIHPLWANAFPKRAIAEGLGGTTIVTFVIESDGSVSSARVSRSSGIPEFDENVRKAVLRAAPFAPLPAKLRPRLVWSMPFIAKNPAVRPRDAAEGSTVR